MAIAGERQTAAAESWTHVVHDWLGTVDHKKIGIMYILMSLVFLVIAGLEAVALRWQLFFPRHEFLSPDVFNQYFTMHGTTMVFFVGMPILFGIGNYIVPLQIGARDMAFPRMNAMGLWATFFGGLLVYASFLTGGAPALGWFAYAPLTEKTFARSAATDLWALGLITSGVGTISGAVNFIATICALRAPGMQLRKIPFFSWTMLWTSVQVLVAIPPLTAALFMVLFDRQFGAHFFDPQNGGSAYLWQHLFWFFGHPEVYILILPAFGMISEVIPVFSRKVLFGYEFMAAATMAIVFISLGVWAHHMFAVGMSRTLDLYFAVASLLVSVPTGIKFFNWLATMYGGRISFESPMLFACGFLSMFLIGGLTGIMLAIAPFDFQLTDSYFVVGHFHWVLIGGTLFATFAGIYYWYPKVTGRLLDERLAAWHFWLLYVGFILTFGPMHVAGFLGMPRRIFTYEADRGWEIWNQLATIGAFVQLPSFGIFVFNLIWSLFRGQRAGDNPWNAWTLEWATTSPPPVYNFETVPTVRSRRPLWDLKHPDDPDWRYEDEYTSEDAPDPTPAPPLDEHEETATERLAEVATGEAAATDAASPDPQTGDAPPAIAAAADAASAAKTTPPTTVDSSLSPAAPSSPDKSTRALSAIEWGMIAFLVSEAAFFATLIVAFIAFLGRNWVGPTAGEVLSIPLAIVTSALLLSSSYTIHVAIQRLEHGDRSGFLQWWLGTIVLGALFLAGTGYEWYTLIVHDGLTMSRNLFGTTFYTLIGFHGLHVTVGLVAMSVIFGLFSAKRLTPTDVQAADVTAWYWHFVDGVWVLVFITVYVVGVLAG